MNLYVAMLPQGMYHSSSGREGLDELAPIDESGKPQLDPQQRRREASEVTTLTVYDSKPAAASAADAATTTAATPATTAAPSSTAASATVPTGFREAAGPSAPSSSPTTPSSASQTHLVASNNVRDLRKPLEH